MPKWEYCIVTGIKSDVGLFTSFPYLIHFTLNNPSGYTFVHLKKTPSEPENVVVAKTIAKLGEDGWEMVNAVYTGNTSWLYFKRLQP